MSGKIRIPDGEPDGSWTPDQIAAYADRLLGESIRSEADPGKHGEGIRARYREAGIEGPQAASDRAAHELQDITGGWLDHDEHRFDVHSSRQSQPADPEAGKRDPRSEPPASQAEDERLELIERAAERAATASEHATHSQARQRSLPIRVGHLADDDEDFDWKGHRRQLERIRRVCGVEAWSVYQMIDRGLSVEDQLAATGWSERTYFRRKAGWERQLAAEMDRGEAST